LIRLILFDSLAVSPVIVVEIVIESIIVSPCFVGKTVSIRKIIGNAVVHSPHLSIPITTAITLIARPHWGCIHISVLLVHWLLG